MFKAFKIMKETRHPRMCLVNVRVSNLSLVLARSSLRKNINLILHNR